MLSNPAWNEEQVLHKGFVVKHETQIQEKDVAIVKKPGGGGGRGGGGGGGRGGGGGGIRGGRRGVGGGGRGGGGGGIRGGRRGVGGGGRGGAGFVAGGVAGSHHHNHSDASCRVPHNYYKLLTTTVAIFYLF
ncbi:hypothetical protein DCAR_0728703 [Daucus carota subsp. sativus]|uniref:Uncharacterized protein n=2 Tax=Daucus carota subsp. sativus TaxID=79200 RepID=A0AAF1B9W4_DAUCS|nr:hypothetical protein DCAR_0728703 [Daucus carota subsp. sativus]